MHVKYTQLLPMKKSIEHFIPNFNIFKGKQMRANYISKCDTRNYMTMQPKMWMTPSFSQGGYQIFMKSVNVAGGAMLKENQHTLVLVGHNLLATLGWT